MKKKVCSFLFVQVYFVESTLFSGLYWIGVTPECTTDIVLVIYINKNKILP